MKPQPSLKKSTVKAPVERVVKECVADLTLENRLLKKA